MSTLIDSKTVLGRWTAALVRLLDADGIDTDQLLEQADITRDVLQSPGSRIPFAKDIKLWKLALEASGDPALGLRLPQFISSSAFMGMGLAMQCAETLEDSLQCLERLCELAADGVTQQLVQEGDRAFVRYVAPAEIEPLLTHAELDASFASLLAMTQQSFGTPIQFIKTVSFKRSPPEDSTPYSAFFNTEVKFNQPHNELELDTSVLHTKNPNAHPELAESIEQEALSYMRRSQLGNIVLQVQMTITDLLAQGEPPTLAAVARQLLVGERQLQRKLTDANSSFASMVQEVRHRMAKQYLRQPRLSIAQITQLVGFTDQSNFTKAFKRWEGESPAAFRKKFNIIDL